MSTATIMVTRMLTGMPMRMTCNMTKDAAPPARVMATKRESGTRFSERRSSVKLTNLRISGCSTWLIALSPSAR